MKTIFLFAAILIGLPAIVVADERPNILFVVADDMSHTSCYGHRLVKTPNFDSLAKDGLIFHRMYTPSSKCAPSRAVMLTGRNPWQLEGAANHKPIWPAKFKSVVEVLTDQGYFTGFTGKGWNPGVHPDNRNLTGVEYNQIKVTAPPTTHVSAYDYQANFSVFLKDKPKGQPFFFWYGAKEPHRGYEFKSGIKAGKKIEDLSFLPSFWGPHETVKHDILDYAVEVEYFDQHLGRILEHLAQAGELKKTLIIATSDNSMPFPRYKGHPHEFATRVPFVVKWPGRIVNPGRACYQFASFVDLAPTFLEAAGVSPEKSNMQEIEGASLFDFFTDTVKGRDHVLTGRERNDMCRPNGWGYPVRSYHEGDFVYMHNFEPDRWPAGTEEAGFRDTDWSPTKSTIVNQMKGSSSFQLCFGKRPAEELYHVVDDPECINNLASEAEHAGKLAELKSKLFQRLMDQGDPRALGSGHIFDGYRPERRKEYDELVQKENRAKTKRK